MLHFITLTKTEWNVDARGPMTGFTFYIYIYYITHTEATPPFHESLNFAFIKAAIPS